MTEQQERLGLLIGDLEQAMPFPSIEFWYQFHSEDFIPIASDNGLRKLLKHFRGLAEHLVRALMWQESIPHERALAEANGYSTAVFDEYCPCTIVHTVQDAADWLALAMHTINAVEDELKDRNYTVSCWRDRKSVTALAQKEGGDWQRGHKLIQDAALLDRQCREYSQTDATFARDRCIEWDNEIGKEVRRRCEYYEKFVATMYRRAETGA